MMLMLNEEESVACTVVAIIIADASMGPGQQEHSSTHETRGKVRSIQLQ